MLHCFKCGTDLPDNLAYCLQCGAALDTETPTVVRPVPEPEPAVVPQPTSGSGAGKFILGSLLGAVAVILLLVIGAFVLFSMRDRETPANISIANTNVNEATPTRSPTPRKPTPSPAASAVNDNTEPVKEAKTCTVTNPAGGSVNLRRYCDTRDCSLDESTLYIQADPGETVEASARKPVTTGRFTWVPVKYHGDLLWISSTRIECE